MVCNCSKFSLTQTDTFETSGLLCHHWIITVFVSWNKINFRCHWMYKKVSKCLL